MIVTHCDRCGRVHGCVREVGDCDPGCGSIAVQLEQEQRTMDLYESIVYTPSVSGVVEEGES